MGRRWDTESGQQASGPESALTVCTACTACTAMKKTGQHLHQKQTRRDGGDRGCKNSAGYGETHREVRPNGNKPVLNRNSQGYKYLNSSLTGERTQCHCNKNPTHVLDSEIDMEKPEV